MANALSPLTTERVHDSNNSKLPIRNGMVLQWLAWVWDGNCTAGITSTSNGWAYLEQDFDDECSQSFCDGGVCGGCDVEHSEALPGRLVPRGVVGGLSRQHGGLQ